MVEPRISGDDFSLSFCLVVCGGIPLGRYCREERGNFASVGNCRRECIVFSGFDRRREGDYSGLSAGIQFGWPDRWDLTVYEASGQEDRMKTDSHFDDHFYDQI